MPRISIWCGLLLLAAAVAGGCCYPGSPYCQRTYPNTMGYTYPSWNARGMATPPNGPPDGAVYGQPMAGNGSQIIDSTGTSATPSFGAQTPTPAGIPNGDGWTPRSN